MNDIFRKFSAKVSTIVGSAKAFVVALLIIIVWSLTGPMFNFSDTWQLIINTGTTIITFLMVFLIQNTQNRDAKAMHLKLDELIQSESGASDKYINLEDLSDKELEIMHEHFASFRYKIEKHTKTRKTKKS
jgi:low affinity Fe/Cu permease